MSLIREGLKKGLDALSAGVIFITSQRMTGLDIKPDYFGGLKYCPDNSICRLKKGPRGLKKGFYLKYTVKYVDWDAASIVPVKVHIFDITDSWEKLETSTAVAKHQCQKISVAAACS
ncbi:hypothetical protein FXO37_28827 [Capsicum annuum]|nr:hypothetical protein FXO37_28827 [Capsicum annuum]